MLRAIKVRLYPNRVQAQAINQNIGNARFVYNHFLSLRKEAYTSNKISLGYYDCARMLTELKKDPEYEFLKLSDSTSLQQALKDMDAAYQNFFKNGSGFPKFHKKRDGYGTFRTVMRNVIKNGKLWAGTHRNIKFRCSDRDYQRLTEYKIRSITISMDAGLYYASCLIELPDPMDVDPEFCMFKFMACGVDLGVKKPVAIAYKTNHGTIAYRSTGLANLVDLNEKEQRRKRYQRRLARKVRGSNNYKKCKTKLQRAFKAERDYRKNFVEQTSRKLANNFSLISFENLKLQNMTRSVRPNADGIRKGKASKSGLNRNLLRHSHYQLRTRTEQKAWERGGIVVAVDPKYTSQQCSCCKSIDKKNRKSQAKFKCLTCGYTKNADYNAARNIMNRALV